MLKIDKSYTFDTEIANYDRLIIVLFELAEKVESKFNKSIEIIETLLQYREQTMPVKLIPNYLRLVKKYNDEADIEKIGTLSKIAALLVFDRSHKKLSHLFQKPHLLRIAPRVSRIEMNEWVIVKIPNLLENMVKYLSIHTAKLTSTQQLLNRLRQIGRQGESGEVSSNPLLGGGLQSLFSILNWESNIQSESQTNSIFEINLFGISQPENNIEQIIKNTKVNEFIFNGDFLDTIEVKNISEPIEESKSEVSSSSASNFENPSSNYTPAASTQDYQNEFLIAYTNVEFLKKLHSSSIVEISFVLSKLMFGSKKLQVQERLHKVGIMNIAIKMFNLLNNIIDSLQPWQDMKVQILKLVINYLSRDSDNISYKLECFEKYEILGMLKQEIVPTLIQHKDECDREIQGFTSYLTSSNQIWTKEGLPAFDESKIGTFAYNFKTSKDKKGFMTMILDSFIQTHNSSQLAINKMNLKYWQGSWIESLVRGWNPYFQLYIARSGLVRILIQDVINIAIQDDSNLQNALDILGETVKFNKRTLLILESQIKPLERHVFEKKLISHLVDSNVFIRSILLTLYKLTIDNPELTPEREFMFDCKFLKNSQLCTFVNENISRILNGILSLINSYNISQTNLSWINTVMIIFIMAKKLGWYSKWIDMLETSYTRKNLKNLLIRWRMSYLYRPKDSYSLQFTTRIDFNEFINLDLVDQL